MRAAGAIAAMLAALLAVAAPGATAATTPPAFGACAKSDGERLWQQTDLAERIEAELGETFAPARQVFGLYRVDCRDLTGDESRELVVHLLGPTASSPHPWAIFQVPAGQSAPVVAFLQTKTSYLRLSFDGATVVERQQILRPTDPSCCPSGGVRKRYLRWNGTRFAYGSGKPDEPPDGPPDGYPVPPPSGGPGCEARVAVGRLELRAACLRRQDDGTYVASGRVRLNGIDLVPAQADAKVVLDPKALELSVKGTVRVQLGPVVLYEGEFKRKVGASFTLKVPGGSSLKGFPVTGEATVTLNAEGAVVEANVAIEALGGVSGSAKLAASMDAGLRLDALKLGVGRATVGAIPISDVSLAYERLADGRDRWAGGATLELPGPKLASLTGSAAFIDGRFAEGFGELTGSVAVFPGIFLTKVRAGLTLEPQFSFTGGMALSAGPRVLGATAASVDGNFTYESGTPATFKLSGDISLVRVKLAGGELAYNTNGQVSMKGNLDLTLGGVGFTADLSGFIDGLRAFNAEGKGTLGYKGKGIGGEGLVSSTGAAACATLLEFLGAKVVVGFGVKWESFPEPKIMGGSCGLDDWRVGPAARASQTRTLRVRPRTRLLAVSAVGAGAAPNVTLRGPGGITIPTPPEGVWTTFEEGRLAFRNPDDATTYFAVGAPRPGRWTLTVEPGSAPVAAIRRANPLPRVRVKARVSGRGAVRRLRWNVAPRKDVRVVFVQRGSGGTRRIAATRGGRGSARFRALAGPGSARRVVALVERAGLPEDQRAVARFRYRTRRPARPARVRVRRNGRRVAVTFRRARGATRHAVRVSVSDGRRLLFLPRRARRVRVPGVARRHRVTATVRGVDALGRNGPPRRARLRR